MNTYVITDADRLRILEFLREYRPYLSSEMEQITLLKKKLADAVIVPESNLARTIISMHTRAKVVDLTEHRAETYTLVYPAQANPSQGRLSLLSPLGTAMLGCEEGDVFECSIPEGTFMYATKEVLYQPEWDERSSAGYAGSVSSAAAPVVKQNNQRYQHPEATMFITQPDHDRLVKVLKTYPAQEAARDARAKLLEKMNAATVVLPTLIPENVVTMNSVVKLIDLSNGLDVTYALAFPSDANVDRLKISVLAPLGMALLGRCEGEIVEYEVPSGTQRYFIRSIVYQPEAQLNRMTPDATA